MMTLRLQHLSFIVGIILLLSNHVVICFSLMAISSFTTRRSSSSLVVVRRSSIGDQCGIRYEEPVFRPPAEWRSLILQVTIGCSWNQCTFCEMYQGKSFRVRPIEDIVGELDRVVTAGGAPYVRDVFLADGDAMMLPTGRLMQILDAIRDRFPKVRRISSYCLPRNLRSKSIDALSKLKSKGLSLVYVGCESGDDTVLAAVQKGETYETSLDALKKLQESGIKRSVMILLGLGGKQHTKNHAIRSAALCSESTPEFLSVLTTSFPRGKMRVEQGYLQEEQKTNNETKAVAFEELDARESLKEMKVFLEALSIPRGAKTIFRSDHASNYLVLKGRLGRDKDKLIADIQFVLDSPLEDDPLNLRPEWKRGL